MDAMKPPAEFFLRSSDGPSAGLDTTRRCRSVRRVRCECRDDFVLAKIEPPLIGQQFGLGAGDVDEVLVVARHEGHTACPVSEWPLHVHVFRLHGASEGRESFLCEHMESVAWAEMYESQEAADQFAG